MKIIFLDIDGVLVNRESLMKQSGLHAKGHPDCVAALNRIIQSTGASIVISSTWRFMGTKRMFDFLREWGVSGKVIGCTPQLESMKDGLYISPTRGSEIKAWLNGTKLSDNFVILDDDGDMDDLSHRLVKTEFESGLTLSDAEKAIRLFA